VTTDDILIQAGAASMFVKLIVDIARMIAPNAPPWLFPVLALAFSPFCLIATTALTAPLVWDQPQSATLFLGSIMTAGVSVGASAMQKKADTIRREGT
jgi:hypothetical protein